MDVDMPDASSTQQKRKRLAKACDACHKSKRRCDGTAPCSNCFYARKECTYTDSAGRPVPAPRSAPGSVTSQSMLDIPRPPSPSRSSAGSSSSHSARTHRPTFSYGPPPSLPRAKRPRLDNQPLSDLATLPNMAIPPVLVAQQLDKSSASLDPATVRERVAVFFAHVYPARLMFHTPSFNARMASGLVPKYLLHAICAAAAPLSPHRPQGSAPRATGMEHAVAAQAILIERGALKDNVGTGIEVVQALCLLMFHEHIAAFPWKPSVHCFDLAQQLLNDHLLFNSALSSMDAEIARRCAWFIRFAYINNLQNHSVATPPQPGPGPRVPLPQDETSFEMEVNGAAPEYIHLPPPPDNQSEFAHVLRTAEIHYSIDDAVNKYDGGHIDRVSLQAAADAAQKELTAWESSLSSVMSYNPAAVDAHLALFDTGTNSAAWCFFDSHTLSACSWLALATARTRLGQPLDAPWAQARMLDIIVKLGRQAAYNVLGVNALKSLDKHCESSRSTTQSQLDGLTHEFQRIWGVRIPPRPMHLAPEQQHPPPRVSPTPSGPRPSTSAASAPVSAGPGPVASGSGYFRSLSMAYNGLGTNAKASGSTSAPWGNTSFAFAGAGKRPAVIGGLDSLGLFDSTADSFTPGGEGTSSGVPPPPVSVFQSSRPQPPLMSQTWRPSWIAPIDAAPELSPAPAVQPYPGGPGVADLQRLKVGSSGSGSGSRAGPSSAWGERPSSDLWSAGEKDKDETGSVCSLPSLKASGLLECGDTTRRVVRSGVGANAAGTGLGIPRGMPWLDTRGAPET